MRFLIIIFLAILWALKPIPYEDVAKNRVVSQEVISLRAGGFDPLQSKSSGSKIPKVILQKYFPDWVERVNYQNQQLKFLQSGKKKLQEADKLRIHESLKLKLLTPQEKDAFDYFRGTGLYQFHQDVSTPPNIFDTRDIFLEKMQNFEMRNKFLNSYNKRQLNENN